MFHAPMNQFFLSSCKIVGPAIISSSKPFSTLVVRNINDLKKGHVLSLSWGSHERYPLYKNLNANCAQKSSLLSLTNSAAPLHTLSHRQLSHYFFARRTYIALLDNCSFNYCFTQCGRNGPCTALTSLIRTQKLVEFEVTFCYLRSSRCQYWHSKLDSRSDSE